MFSLGEPAVAPRALWPHQERALGELRQALGEGSKRVVLQAPTGSGKTKLASEMVRGALRKGKRVIFTVPALSLVTQTVEAFEAEGINAIGVLQGFNLRTDTTQPVQVASIQTLKRRCIPPADLVIVDEAHRQSRFMNSWLGKAEWARVPFIGLTATPWAKGMGKHYGKLIIGATISELIEAGRLSPFRVFAPSHPDLSGVKIVAGEYHEGELSEVMSERKIVADVVETWKRLGPGNKTLCFAVDRAHAAHLQREFTEGGVFCAYIDAFTEGAERERIKHEFHKGRTQVVVSIGTMIAGIDWDVRCISWCRPTKSIITWVQAFGRALRLGEGKEHAVILDHADTALTLGLPTEIHRDKLDDGKPKTPKEKALEKKIALPKECKNCGVLKPPKVHQCPACGHRPERQSEVIVEDGELFELGTQHAAKEKYTSAEKAAIFGQLKCYAERHGYASGWAAHKHRERTGTWPNAYRDVPPQEPSPELCAWLKSRQIAYAKRRKVA